MYNKYTCELKFNLLIKDIIFSFKINFLTNYDHQMFIYQVNQVISNKLIYTNIF